MFTLQYLLTVLSYFTILICKLYENINFVIYAPKPISTTVFNGQLQFNITPLQAIIFCMHMLPYSVNKFVAYLDTFILLCMLSRPFLLPILHMVGSNLS